MKNVLFYLMANTGILQKQRIIWTMKKTRTVALISTAFVGSALAFNAFADDHKHEHHDHEHNHDEHEHHGKHEHGVADMDIALDNGQLLVQLKSPAANFLGFEYEPSTKAQKKAYAHVTKTLNNPKKILDLDGGKCKITDKDVDMPFALNNHDHKHEHHSDEHKHEAHHDEHDHEKHDHDEQEHAATHSDIEFTYLYTCKKPEKLEHIEVELFERFNGFEKINVQWVANNQQGSATLSPKNHVIELHTHWCVTAQVVLWPELTLSISGQRTHHTR